MKSSRRRLRRPPNATPSLFDSVTASVPPLFCSLSQGNYATCSIRRWLETDPLTVELCQQWTVDAHRQRRRNPGAGSVLSVLTQMLAAEVPNAIAEWEPSPAYARELTECSDVQWPVLAEELLAS